MCLLSVVVVLCIFCSILHPTYIYPDTLKTQKRRTVKKEMSDVEEVRRVFGDPCPSTVRVKILVGEVRNLKCTGAVLKRLMVDVPPPAKVRSFSVRSTIARRF